MMKHKNCKCCKKPFLSLKRGKEAVVCDACFEHTTDGKLTELCECCENHPNYNEMQIAKALCISISELLKLIAKAISENRPISPALATHAKKNFKTIGKLGNQPIDSKLSLDDLSKPTVNPKSDSQLVSDLEDLNETRKHVGRPHNDDGWDR